MLMGLSLLIYNILPKWSLPARTFCKASSATCMFDFGRGTVFAPIRNSHVNDDFQKPLGRCT